MSATANNVGSVQAVGEILKSITLPFGLIYRYKDNHLQVGMFRRDTYTHQQEYGWGGKAYVSLHSTDDEIVKKVFGLALDYLEHEAREGFKYKNKRIFGPHISLEALMQASGHTTYRKQPTK